MALLANIHRDPKRSRAFKPNDFNPWTAGERGSISVETLTREILLCARAKNGKG